MADLTDPTFWIPTIISIIAISVSYLDVRRRQHSDREATEALLALIKTMKEELDLLEKQSTDRTDLSKAALLQKQEEANWRKLRDIGKGVKWFLDALGDE